ncbi:MAG: fructosamine kinase family protein [Gammaproteobacteria bacterium]|nr:fructosamine kinase family protein [Gammaproteobacteria bacterium]
MSVWDDIVAAITEASGKRFVPNSQGTLGGGCINSAFRLSNGEHDWFVKTNHAARIDMFDAEAAGLNALADSATLKVPRALCTGTSGDTAFIVMQHIRFGNGSTRGWQAAGRGLAAMHAHNAHAFGWERNNTIGASPQPNAWRDDWITFWREQRLGFQLGLAARHNHGSRLQKLGDQLLTRFHVLVDHAPQPSLLHGDLWGGNLSFDSHGEPVIYDPATYFGDREADLAMTELFGGFSPDFYAAYREAWPIDAGYRVRKTLYNLYHVLNHLNLFGGSYGAQAERMMQSLLAEC